MEEKSDRMQVQVFTRNYQLAGYVSILSGVRLTDYMNESKSFVPVTDVRVYDHGGRSVFAAAFLNVRRDAIELIVPASEIDA